MNKSKWGSISLVTYENSEDQILEVYHLRGEEAGIFF